jgi:hypothetical protein
VPDYERRGGESTEEFVDRTTKELHVELRSKLDAVFRKLYIVCAVIAVVCFVVVFLLGYYK